MKTYTITEKQMEKLEKTLMSEVPLALTYNIRKILLKIKTDQETDIDKLIEIEEQSQNELQKEEAQMIMLMEEEAKAEEEHQKHKEEEMASLNIR